MGLHGVDHGTGGHFSLPFCPLGEHVRVGSSEQGEGSPMESKPRGDAVRQIFFWECFACKCLPERCAVLRSILPRVADDVVALR